VHDIIMCAELLIW